MLTAVCCVSSWIYCSRNMLSPPWICLYDSMTSSLLVSHGHIYGSHLALKNSRNPSPKTRCSLSSRLCCCRMHLEGRTRISPCPDCDLRKLEAEYMLTVAARLMKITVCTHRSLGKYVTF